MFLAEREKGPGKVRIKAESDGGSQTRSLSRALSDFGLLLKSACRGGSRLVRKGRGKSAHAFAIADGRVGTAVELCRGKR